MRCPKCGYNSFDHLDSCKKCGKDLVEFKQSFGIKSVLFPGQMSVSGGAEEPEFDSVAADAAVTAATGTVTAAESAPSREPVVDGTDGDDFGFDFMGDSAEDDDLSFDELFEEAPDEEDVEETIEAPKDKKAAAEAEAGEDFSFDLPDDDDELEDDFGFDPTDKVSGAAEDSDFSFEDEPKGTVSPDPSETKEDPPRPFDLPESPQPVGAPVSVLKTSEKQNPHVSIVEDVAKPIDKDASLAPDGEGEIFVLEMTEMVPPSLEEPIDVEASLEEESSHRLNDFSTVVPAAPAVDGAPRSRCQHPSLASCVGAFAVDAVILLVVGISFVVAAEAAMSTEKTRLFPSLETMVDLSVPYFLVLFFLAFGYFTLFHFLTGQTPGKMLAGLRVEAIDGGTLIFSQAFLRSVGGLFQLIPVGLGYLLVLTSPERRGWNDRLAGTRVVVLRHLPVEV
ncbi:Uncharacterized membrane protein YckC, RDD family [Desulfuromusa kysingii]|uniref:Uncharacterized membrane protein YckC, RDD family n=1 Tax=Desulfuromusa kysingii TaxID=37625 RepID=A0A1H3XLG3_9BACT|nr:RDD family protein [Desulfuromusa kysingii]SDZ99781.1 Uncharacterized membrane protein YckC, RDD family [Desulfuromusa kysingii]